MSWNYKKIKICNICGKEYSSSVSTLNFYKNKTNICDECINKISKENRIKA